MRATVEKRSRARNVGAVLLAIIAGVAHGICFAPFDVWPLAFVALVPLLVAIRGRSVAAGALLGWIEGTVVAAIAVGPWVVDASHGFFRQGALAAAVFGVAIGQLFGALPIALFGALAARLMHHPVAALRVLGLAAAWTAVELLRSHFLLGAPWDLLGHALHAHPLWMQTAEVGGVFAVSFVLASSSAALAEVASAPRRDGVASVAVAVALLVLTAIYGAVRLDGEDRAAGRTLRVALVQGDIPNSWRSDPARAGDALGLYTAATRDAMATRPELVVWPENAISVLLEPNPRFAEAARAALGADGARLLLGTPRAVPGDDGRVRFYNSAQLLSAGGEVLGIYDKRHLVPFAEYAPLPGLHAFGWRFPAPGDYAAGTTPTVFGEPAPFGVLICFEAIYPALARDLVRDGAQLLLNLSNDAWFQTRSGREQHFAATVFRAVETRRALARVANAGITAVIAPSGRVVERLPSRVQTARVVSLPLRDGLTPYARFGDVFALAAGLFALAVLWSVSTHARGDVRATGSFRPAAEP